MKFSRGIGLSINAHDQEAVQLITSHKMGDIIEFGVVKKGITDPQRGAEHVWFKQVTDLFNKHEITQEMVYRKGVPWSSDGMDVKKLWRMGAGAVCGVKSTEQVPPDKVNDVFHWVCGAIYSALTAREIEGVVLPEFPSWHNQGN